MGGALRQGVAALEAASAPRGSTSGPTSAGRPAPASPGTSTCTPCPAGSGDTNFMTAVAGTRVLPETLAETWGRLTAAWPA